MILLWLLAGLFVMGSFLFLPAKGWTFYERIGICEQILLLFVSVVAYIRKDAIFNWIRHKVLRKHFADTGIRRDTDEVVDALLFTVSNKMSNDVPLKLLADLKPRHVGLIYSNDEESGKVAQAISAKAAELGIAVLPSVPINGVDLRDIREKAITLIKRARLAGALSIAVEITGGLKPMSIGAFMAAEEEAVSTMYIKSDYDRSNRIISGTEHLVYISRHES